MTENKKRILLWPILCAGMTSLILWLSLIPTNAVPSVGLGWDKLNHAAAIAVVTWLAFLAFRPYRRAARAAFGYALLLGVLIEVLQATFTSTRCAEWGDLLADLVGAGLVWCLISIFQRKWEPR